MPYYPKQKEGIEFVSIPENPDQNKGIESRRNAGEPKIKKEGIESRRDVREAKSNQRDSVWARYPITQNKTKGSNTGVMPENPKQKKGIESGRNTRKLE